MAYATCSQGERLEMASKNPGDPSNSDIMNLLKDFIQKQQVREDDLNKSINYCHEKLDANSDELNKINLRLNAYSDSLEQLKNENCNLRKNLSSCVFEIDKLEQYTRRNTIEIHGVPLVKGEDVYGLVQQIGTALSMHIPKNAIDICHRLPTRSSNTSQPIICKFVNRYTKDDLIIKRKVMRNLSAIDIGFTVADVIYINENLTPKRRQLLYKMRQLQKDLKFKFLWTKNGNIYARKDEKCPVAEITSDSDIARVKSGAL
ncbi:uncharacterized protein LOC116163995 [Photinus pyralis]|nr:uncharacterized protein LOC116159645 [Photinus pyralis]XP_031333983.1 uncharacterized protein LOC116163995 [Photinus pyralis]